MNSEQPLVSVVMPTYSQAQFIGDAVKSVLDQTYANFELIIIDNYSEDNTEDIIASFNDTRIKYEKFRNNGIIAASRNVGISESRGKYIAFLDSDDMWKPTKIEKQIELLENDNNVFLVYSRLIVIKNGLYRKTLPKRKRLRSGNAFIPLFLSNNFIGTSSVLLRNDLKENNFLFDTDKRLIAIEDYDLWLRIAKNKQIAYVEEPLVVYREHGCNTSRGIKSSLCRYLQLMKKNYHSVSKILLIMKYILIFKAIGLLIIKKALAKVFI
ncbi:MAG: glycosyltransferase [Candidatus Scalindua sp.]|nr:glycosyltransferase [Candidatus Scalindua sp.]